jgi:voltage-gated potassium channel
MSGPIGTLTRPLAAPLRGIFLAPLMRRLGFHVKRMTGGLDRHFFLSLLVPVLGFVIVAAIAVTLIERVKRTLAALR